MSASEVIKVEFPVMRYDITMPLLEGRVPIEGVVLKPVKSSSMINKEDPKLKAGDFGLMDLNIGYFLPAIEAGWEIIGLPVFINSYETVTPLNRPTKDSSFPSTKPG